MIHQFTHEWGQARYWINESDGRRALAGRAGDRGQIMDYQNHRLAFRRIGRSTDERAMIATILPKNTFASESFNLSSGPQLEYTAMLYLTAVLNSFVLDYALRQRISANINMFYVYQLPVPRLVKRDQRNEPIVIRVAKLICTTHEFDDLGRSLGLDGHRSGAVEPAERARLRAELDGLVAHLYGLTEEEFAHVLRTFPLVAADVKAAALEQYRALAPKPGDPQIARLIQEGESSRLEFKSSARWNVAAKMHDKKMEDVVLKTVAGFLNASGGTLLIGVKDDGTVCGLEPDYATLGAKGNRDGFELYLTELLHRDGGFGLAGLINVSIREVDGKEVCRVDVQPSPKAVWIKRDNLERLYVRVGNATRDLLGSEAVEYVKRHWA